MISWYFALHSYGLFVPRWLPVFVGQWNGDLTAAESHGRAEGRDENVESTHPHGAHARQEGVAQLYAGHHKPETIEFWLLQKVSLHMFSSVAFKVLVNCVCVSSNTATFYLL